MNDWMIFAERLSEQMKKQNLSVRQLAERMDMTPTTIFRYARGQRVPRANEILKASDVLGVTCDYLIGLSDDPKKTSRPTVQPERKTGEWTTEQVAELLANLFGDECACNFSGIDEWLSCACKYSETTCPEPKEKHGCWMQFLIQGCADMRGEANETD